ncbi:MAG: 3-dehydroquinate synthase, partial [Clostridia bacterium]|nr:3-dehydroquinate synthase [Clostridia bacterium]
MSTKTIHVNASRDYDVLIGSGLLNDTGKLVKDVHAPCKVCIVCDSNVAPLYRKTVQKSLEAEGFETVIFTFPAGESSKTLD